MSEDPLARKAAVIKASATNFLACFRSRLTVPIAPDTPVETLAAALLADVFCRELMLEGLSHGDTETEEAMAVVLACTLIGTARIEARPERITAFLFGKLSSGDPA